MIASFWFATPSAGPGDGAGVPAPGVPSGDDAVPADAAAVPPDGRTFAALLEERSRTPAPAEDLPADEAVPQDAPRDAPPRRTPRPVPFPVLLPEQAAVVPRPETAITASGLPDSPESRTGPSGRDAPPAAGRPHPADDVVPSEDPPVAAPGETAGGVAPAVTAVDSGTAERPALETGRASGSTEPAGRRLPAERPAPTPEPRVAGPREAPAPVPRDVPSGPSSVVPDPAFPRSAEQGSPPARPLPDRGARPVGTSASEQGAAGTIDSRGDGTQPVPSRGAARPLPEGPPPNPEPSAQTRQVTSTPPGPPAPAAGPPATGRRGATPNLAPDDAPARRESAADGRGDVRGPVPADRTPPQITTPVRAAAAIDRRPAGESGERPPGRRTAPAPVASSRGAGDPIGAATDPTLQAPAVTRAMPAPPRGSRLAQLVERIVTEIGRADARAPSVTIRIGRDDDDPVLVRFQRRGDALHVRLVAVNPARADELARDLPQLRQALAGEGPRVSVDVSSGDGGRASAGSPAPQESAPAPRHGPPSPDVSPPTPPVASPRRSGGTLSLLDVLA